MRSTARAGAPTRLVRREQGWSLTFSASGISFRRFCWVDEAPAWPAPPAPSRRLFWLAPLLLGGGSVAAGVLAAPAISHDRAYSVTRIVPDRAAPAIASPPRFARPARRARAKADDDAPVAGAGTAALTEQRYVDRAMRTGEMQSWETAGLRHFLVAGDIRRDGDRACRQFSLLARPDDGPDSVRQFERCRAFADADPIPATDGPVDPVVTTTVSVR